jgi:NADH-quinone oxidoreductase subunit I
MIGILRGFATTFSHMVRPAITERYPTTKPNLPERSRGSLALARGENGELLCRACSLCERECPDDALIVEVEKGPEGKGRVLVSLTLDLGRCMFCGLCVEGCPSDALVSISDFEHATPDRDMTRVSLYQRSPEEAEAAAAAAAARAVRASVDEAEAEAKGEPQAEAEAKSEPEAEAKDEPEADA